MKRQLNKAAMLKWSLSQGGLIPAAEEIQRALGCSRSKADKIAAGRYGSTPSPLEIRELSRLTKINAETLWRTTGRSTAKAS